MHCMLRTTYLMHFTIFSSMLTHEKCINEKSTRKSKRSKENLPRKMHRQKWTFTRKTTEKISHEKYIDENERSHENTRKKNSHEKYIDKNEHSHEKIHRRKLKIEEKRKRKLAHLWVFSFLRSLINNILNRLERNQTIEEFCNHWHKSIMLEFSHAIVWGCSAKYQLQRCGKDHVFQDEDIVLIAKRTCGKW